MTEQELSEKLAKAYGVLSHMVESPVNGDKSEWLIKDTARIMELAFEHDFDILILDSLSGKYVEVGIQDEVALSTESFADHPTKKDAILWAVGLALLKKAEGSKA
jgi:hypothetical protein